MFDFVRRGFAQSFIRSYSTIGGTRKKRKESRSQLQTAAGQFRQAFRGHSRTPLVPETVDRERSSAHGDTSPREIDPPTSCWVVALCWPLGSDGAVGRALRASAYRGDGHQSILCFVFRPRLCFLFPHGKMTANSNFLLFCFCFNAALLFHLVVHQVGQFPLFPDF